MAYDEAAHTLIHRIEINEEAARGFQALAELAEARRPADCFPTVDAKGRLNGFGDALFRVKEQAIRQSE